jgi:5-methylcytosine-specific restriction endonuclease McrA
MSCPTCARSEKLRAFLFCRSIIMPTRAPQFRPVGWSPAKRQRIEARDSYYDSKEWKALREACKRRDGYCCADPNCETPGRGRGGRLIADHIVARSAGGADALGNLLTRCPACDNRKHGRRGRP